MYVCMCAYMCMCMYMYMYMYMYMNMNMCISVSLSLYIYIYISAPRRHAECCDCPVSWPRAIMIHILVMTIRTLIIVIVIIRVILVLLIIVTLLVIALSITTMHGLEHDFSVAPQRLGGMLKRTSPLPVYISLSIYL